VVVLGCQVPALVIDEFDCNRPRREDALTKSVVDRLRQFRRDLRRFVGERDELGCSTSCSSTFRWSTRPRAELR
jgi:hypothetical protein